MKIEYPDAFYHIISHGNGVSSAFQRDADFERLIGFLESAAGRHRIRIHCFCLMPNHCHMILETIRGSLSSILLYLNMGDAEYLTKKPERKGDFFQSQCRVILIHDDSHLLELSRYIHVNPVRAHLVNDPSQYPWSSYLAYLGVEKRWDWVHTHFILSQLGSDEKEARRRYRNYIWGAIREIVGHPLEKAATLGISERVGQVMGSNGRGQRM